MITCARHWKRMDAIRDTTGTMPENAFDFISLHARQIPDTEKMGREKPCAPYNLLAPMCIVARRPRLNWRPKWERIMYARKADAVKAARKLARIFRTYVVDCCHIRYLGDQE